MNATHLLKKDHATVKELFIQFEKAGDRAYQKKQTIFEKIHRELETHWIDRDNRRKQRRGPRGAARDEIADRDAAIANFGSSALNSLTSAPAEPFFLASSTCSCNFVSAAVSGISSQ